MTAVSTGRRRIGLQTLAGRARGLRLSHVAWFLPALYALWNTLEKLPPSSVKLLPDAETYYLTSIYFDPDRWLGDLREPLFPMANAVVMEIFGETTTSLRVFTIVIFVALVLATQYLAREYFGTWGAIAVGAVLAMSEWLQLQAITGLREEAATLGLVLIAILVTRLKPGWRFPLLLGLLVGASAMIRWDTLIVALPVVALAYLLHRVPVRRVAASAAVFAVIVVPFCIGNASQFGDPLHHSNVHSKFFRNFEFQGQPGYVTKEQFAKDAFAGEDETWLSYLFEDHDVGWVVDHTWHGTFNTALTNWTFGVLGPTQIGPRWGLVSTSVTSSPTQFVPWALLLAMLAGAVALLRVRNGWIISAMMLLALVQHAPIQHLMDARLSLSAMPFMVIAVGFFVRTLYLRFLEEAGRAAARSRVEA